eukprot:GHVU01073370.1.p1 GENE.GHVU01073370.1~~GHVU01073370.1.p1  ORF type:complete len:146 (-),score=15.61 GHVU01073370.1:90-482(-)
MGAGRWTTESPDDSLGLPEFLEDLYKQSTQPLQEESDHQLIRNLLSGFQDIFMGPNGLGQSNVGIHEIDTGENRPVKQRPYRMSAEGHRIVERECEDMLEKGVIRDSKSPWSSPVVLVTKKSGDVRFCVD